MWLPNSDEYQYFKHLERDLDNAMGDCRKVAPPRIFAARNKGAHSDRPIRFHQTMRIIRQSLGRAMRVVLNRTRLDEPIREKV